MMGITALKGTPVKCTGGQPGLQLENQATTTRICLHYGETDVMRMRSTGTHGLMCQRWSPPQALSSLMDARLCRRCAWQCWCSSGSTSAESCFELEQSSLPSWQRPATWPRPRRSGPRVVRSYYEAHDIVLRILPLFVNLSAGMHAPRRHPTIWILDPCKGTHGVGTPRTHIVAA